MNVTTSPASASRRPTKGRWRRLDMATSWRFAARCNAELSTSQASRRMTLLASGAGVVTIMSPTVQARVFRFDPRVSPSNPSCNAAAFRFRIPRSAPNPPASCRFRHSKSMPASTPVVPCFDAITADFESLPRASRPVHGTKNYVIGLFAVDPRTTRARPIMTPLPTAIRATWHLLECSSCCCLRRSHYRRPQSNASKPDALETIIVQAIDSRIPFSTSSSGWKLKTALAR